MFNFRSNQLAISHDIITSLHLTRLRWVKSPQGSDQFTYNENQFKTELIIFFVKTELNRVELDLLCSLFRSWIELDNIFFVWKLE